MSGVIGVISGELARYSAFAASLATVTAPPDTRIVWAASCSITSNLNSVTRQALEDGAEWLWILGDDHIIPQDLLLRLLARNVDIVAPLCVMRQPPYPATVFERGPEGYTFRTLTGGRQGLVSVDACGNAGLLIRRPVLTAMPEPWWEGGKIDSSKLAEDVYFCQKARDLGYTVYVDTDQGLGHITPVSLWPAWRETGALGAKIAVAGAYVFDAQRAVADPKEDLVHA